MENDYRRHPHRRSILRAFYFPHVKPGEEKSNMARWADLARFNRARRWYHGDMPRERSSLEITGSWLAGLPGLLRFFVLALIISGFIWMLLKFF